MIDLRTSALVAITGTVLIGTGYSIANNSYLDTSNPLVTSLPHHLQATHYFASKKNFLNVIFIKKAWGWTSATFMLMLFTSPPLGRKGVNTRIIKWITTTGMWLLFTSWFFGPALFERLIVLSGGECIAQLPYGDNISVPFEYCYTKSSLSPATHPDLFIGVSPLVDTVSGWATVPRLRRGHDVSGHIFLLTMSILFLTDQIQASSTVPKQLWPRNHVFAVGANAALIAIWLFSSYTTSLYFHSPSEKFSGFLLGLGGYYLTQFIAPALAASVSEAPDPAETRLHAE